MKIIYHKNKLHLDFDEAKENEQLQKYINGEIDFIEINIRNLIPLSNYMIKNVSSYWQEKNLEKVIEDSEDKKNND